jgi:BirA family biotin operon repressor/biotin-[acetyl-CoA-carboxylase] ligase
VSLQYEILKSLSDGHFHSGEQLAQQLSVTRAAIWKAIKAMQQKYGVDIHSVHGRGYCLAHTFELLDTNRIRDQMRHAVTLSGMDSYLTIDSTNHYLMQQAALELTAPHVVFAEHQTGGRGRRSRPWVSPFSGNIYMSLLWRFQQVPSELMGLSLAIGVAVCRALGELGVTELSLKWPNDILCQGRKLCGILVEMHGESNGPYAVVVGLGLNVYMDKEQSRAIEQPWIDLSSVMRGKIARNKTAALLTDYLIETMQTFESSGLTSFIQEWRARDAYKDKNVQMILAEQTIEGISRGIDNQGALLIEQNGKTMRFYSGEISLRAGST